MTKGCALVYVQTMANAVKEKSLSFAVRIVRLHRYLTEEKREYVLSKQLLRCGTSIGANIAEALGGVSRADFHNKMYISFKECLETQYWLDLLLLTDFLTASEHASIQADCDELRKLLSSITMSTKKIPNS